MNFNLTWNTSAAESNLTRLRAGDFSWPHSEIAALEKCAGEAGNRHGSDLGMRLTNLKPGTTMNLNPAELLNPIFNALDDLIENDGVYLYLVLVWLALAVIVWIISGGLRKRMKGNAATVVPGIIFTMQPPIAPASQRGWQQRGNRVVITRGNIRSSKVRNAVGNTVQ